jgi:hypothetical protein
MKRHQLVFLPLLLLLLFAACDTADGTQNKQIAPVAHTSTTRPTAPIMTPTHQSTPTHIATGARRILGDSLQQFIDSYGQPTYSSYTLYTFIYAGMSIVVSMDSTNKYAISITYGTSNGNPVDNIGTLEQAKRQCITFLPNESHYVQTLYNTHGGINIAMIHHTSALSSVPKSLFQDAEGNDAGAPGMLEITYDLNPNDTTRVMDCSAQIGLN